MTTNIKFEGQCKCGDNTWTCSATPEMAAICHCRDCQYSSGGTNQAEFLVPLSSVKMTGKPSSYVATSDAGNQVTRQFCGNCGSPLYSFADNHADKLVIKMGSMNNPNEIVPQFHMFTESATSWDVIVSGLRFPGNPTPA